MPVTFSLRRYFAGRIGSGSMTKQERCFAEKHLSANDDESTVRLCCFQYTARASRERLSDQCMSA